MENNKIDLSIIVPVFNEEESITKLYSEVKKNIKDIYSWELIFINDGSSDQTKKNILEITRINSNVILIHSEVNKGKSESLSIGFKSANGNIIITMDGDLQDDPKEINKFINKINDGSDMVSGWKKKRNDPISKRLPSKFFNFVLKIISGIRINDFNCGFKAYKRCVAKTITLYGGLHRFIPILVKKNGFEISEIIVNHRKREFGESKFGNSRIFHGFFDLITIVFLNKYFDRPLHFFGMIGFILTSIGFIINFYLTYFWIYNNYYLLDSNFTINRPLLFLGILILIVGVQMISVGLIGELFVRYYKKEKNSEYIYYNINK